MLADIHWTRKTQPDFDLVTFAEVRYQVKMGSSLRWGGLWHETTELQLRRN